MLCTSCGEMDTALFVVCVACKIGALISVMENYGCLISGNYQPLIEVSVEGICSVYGCQLQWRIAGYQSA